MSDLKKTWINCSKCGGVGTLYKTWNEVCHGCGGKGYDYTGNRCSMGCIQGKIHQGGNVTCPSCNGERGRYI
jgi:DnaJ-class molecular chaperone